MRQNEEAEQVPDLARFVTAQEDIYPEALAELRAGAKRTHWMWFVFPQLRGLGRSKTAHFYGIADRDEAAAYINHPLLGVRLRECTEAMLMHAGTLSANAILGNPDDLKFRSCMTLFAAVEPDEPLWPRALAAFCGDQVDAKTLGLLRRPEPMQSPPNV